MRIYAVAMTVLLALAGCKRTPQRRVEIKQLGISAVKPEPASPAPTKPKRTADAPGDGAEPVVSPGTRERVRLSTRETPDEIVVAAPATPAGAPGPAPTKQAKVDSGCDGLDAYPWPRSYEQAITDASRGARKPGFSPEVAMIIGPDGRITHLRFTRLSGLDSVDRRALEFVTKQHYKPTVLNGERVAVCSIMVILTHFE
jgi:outer membrane biosynthesis protein TonB